MELKDWAALYPVVPIRTISLCLWEASQTARSNHSDEDQNAAVVWLVAERLGELNAMHSAVSIDR
jgi:hypothetical protein